MSEILWYYVDRVEQRQGPMPAQVLRDAYRRGQLDDETLVWRDGMSQWQPLKLCTHELGVEDGPGQPLPPPPAADASPYAPPTATVRQASHYVASSDIVYAGFWRRWAALFVDAMLLGIVNYAIFAIVMLVFGMGGMLTGGTNPGELQGAQLVMVLAMYIVGPTLSALYYVLQESSEAQATLGKRLLGIKVTDTDGRRLSRLHALGRWFSHLLCYMTAYIGYLVVAFTDRKQGLHDMAAGTLVVDQWAYTDRPDLQKRELGGCLVTFIVVVFGGSILAVIGFIALLASLGGSGWR